MFTQWCCIHLLAGDHSLQDGVFDVVCLILKLIMASVRVAVRVRPLNKREKKRSSKVVIQMKGGATSIQKPSAPQGDKQKNAVKTFTYDFSYDSSDRRSPIFASQEKIYCDLGLDVLKAAFEGFNVCVFAYGQTGSGKSYTMMGNPEDKGLIPRICEGLFCEMFQRSTNDAVSFHTEVSYLEIYNERVLDLLQSRSAPTDGGGLKVREHPQDGPYVENLSKHVVNNHSDMECLINLGNASRTTASTGMNDCSSRSHAIFTISFTQAWFESELPRETLSKIHLVDLAGSERADATGTKGSRLKEGANINKSLVTLGSVISALAVSPADLNYVETLGTLRYASRAKNIVNSPVVNEDDSAKLIRELQEELTRLQTLLGEASQVPRGELSPSVKTEEEELTQNEEEVGALTREWTHKWSETQSVLQEEAVALRKEGGGVVLDCMLPHLIGMDEDLLCRGIILYYLKEGRTLIGSDEASCSQGVVLHGPGLLGEHCVFEHRAGTVTLIPQDGALCSVDGSVVTDPCQLTQGAVIHLGRGTKLRFNHPGEAAQIRETPQSEPLSPFSLSLTDTSKSSENQSKMIPQDPGSMEEKLNQQEVGWKQVQESLNRRTRDFKRLSKENSGAPHQQRAEQKTTGAEMEDPGTLHMDLLSAQTAESRVPRRRVTCRPTTPAIPGKHPVPHITAQVDRNLLQGWVSTREGQEQERGSSHKSGLGLVSAWLWRKARSVAGDAGYKREEVWSGDASLQQTSVLGLGDGCGMKPEGNANEIQGVVADGYKGRPGSGGSSLGSVSHLQRGRSSSTSVLPQTGAHSQLSEKLLGTQAACCPQEESTFKGQSGCREMDECGGLEEFQGDAGMETAAHQKSGLSSLVSRVSWIVQDAGRLLWSSPSVLQQVRKDGLQPLRASLSSQVASLFKESNVLSAVKDSPVLTTFKGSFVFSLFKDSHIFSLVKELPLIQHVQVEITQNLQSEEAAWIIQECIQSEYKQIPVLTQTQSVSTVEELQNDVPLILEDITYLRSVKMQKQAHVEEEENVTNPPPENKDQTLKKFRSAPDIKDVKICTQTLIPLPASLSNLQTQPLEDLLHSLESIVSTSVLTSQKTLALFWVNAATCVHPEPRPALLILVETGLYTLTDDSGLLVLFHHLPLLQLQEVHMGFAGSSLRLMGATEDSILGVYTHSQTLSKELCSAMLGVICPEDERVSRHPLLHGDLMKMSLGWQDFVPDLLLDAGLRVCSQFQRSLADLVYLLHCNMDGETVTLGEVQILLFTGVGVCTGGCHQTLAQFLLTDTHLGLVQEDAVFHPLPRSVTITPCHPQFHNLTLRRRSDVRCVLMHGEDNHGAVTLDVILANVRGRGHPESATEAATPPVLASNSSPHAEMWKLTFSCSSEAACLINHLSNV
ncbi:uncharacterized protein kif16bb isoform X2 [Notolabrus celidotus]|uniref:uncharacterized protein kif16bb isoform X2 n=1 Tax=Notolabrus celidotus TaxID=1203425 RepID=UPI00148FAFF0|nr:uncharacterized protein kif16bb isoform X2 [Notolabrus celidotus]